MKTKAETEIIPPERRDKLQQEGIDLRTRLGTTGQIKTELGKMYRRVRMGRMDHDVARTCTGILRVMLKATEQEHMFQLAAENPDDDTPSLTGVVIIGPGATKADLKNFTGPAHPTRKRGSE